ncbi:hypothetical protein ACFVTP_33155 [Streptomyces celluloflavus]|uniref:hypothetical protein n=1 Tax=Streptomyces celluloflavus TaxID=58344 RepID=UPI0036DD6DFE
MLLAALLLGFLVAPVFGELLLDDRVGVRVVRAAGCGEQLAALLAAVLHGLAPLRTGRASASELAAAIEGTTGLLERLEAVRDASLRQPVAKDVSHADLAAAMHLESRATAQSRRRTLLNKPVSDLERWATGVAD